MDKGIVRPLANFHPDIWGDTFSNYTTDEVTQNQKEQEVKERSEEVPKELLADAKDPKERLIVIDAIERLGVSYYFEEEIEANLQQFVQEREGLHYTSLRFRLLRQHGFHVSCDVFDKFKDENGSFKYCLINDVLEMLNLYEASHLRLRGGIILDEALDFTITHLKSLASSLSSPLLAELITHALKQPVYRRSIRLEAKYQISVYESDASHHPVLLRLAKLDFNLLQLRHKKELSNIIRWSRSLDFTGKFPFAKDRVAESYIWTLAGYYEPKHSYARMILNKVFKLLTIIDDVYDAYGVIDELEPFTKAILRLV